MVMPAWMLTVWTWMTWLFEKGLALFTTAWKTSKQATEIAIVAFVMFVVLIYFGFIKKPNVAPELSAQIAQLSMKVDRMQADMATSNDISFIEDQIAGITKAQTSNAGVRRSKKKVAE